MGYFSGKSLGNENERVEIAPSSFMLNGGMAPEEHRTAMDGLEQRSVGTQQQEEMAKSYEPLRPIGQ